MTSHTAVVRLNQQTVRPPLRTANAVAGASAGGVHRPVAAATTAAPPVRQVPSQQRSAVVPAVAAAATGAAARSHAISQVRAAATSKIGATQPPVRQQYQPNASALADAGQDVEPDGLSSNYYAKVRGRPITVIEEKGGRFRALFAGADGRPLANSPLVSVESPPMYLNPQGNMTGEGNAFLKGDDWQVWRTGASFSIGLNEGITDEGARVSAGGVDLVTVQREYIGTVAEMSCDALRALYRVKSTNADLTRIQQAARASARDQLAAEKKMNVQTLTARLKAGGQPAMELRKRLDEIAVEKFVAMSPRIQGKATEADIGIEDAEDAEDVGGGDRANTPPMVWLASRVYKNQAYTKKGGKKTGAPKKIENGPDEFTLPSTNENMPRIIEAMGRLGYKYKPIAWKIAVPDPENPTKAPQLRAMGTPTTTVVQRNAHGRPMVDKDGQLIQTTIPDYWTCPGLMRGDTPMQSLVVCQAIAIVSVSKQGCRVKWVLSGPMSIMRRVPRASSTTSTWAFPKPAGLEDDDEMVKTTTSSNTAAHSKAAKSAPTVTADGEVLLPVGAEPTDEFGDGGVYDEFGDDNEGGADAAADDDLGATDDNAYDDLGHGDVVDGGGDAVDDPDAVDAPPPPPVRLATTADTQRRQAGTKRTQTAAAIPVRSAATAANAAAAAANGAKKPKTAVAAVAPPKGRVAAPPPPPPTQELPNETFAEDDDAIALDDGTQLDDTAAGDTAVDDNADQDLVDDGGVGDDGGELPVDDGAADNAYPDD